MELYVNDKCYYLYWGKIKSWIITRKTKLIDETLTYISRSPLKVIKDEHINYSIQNKDLYEWYRFKLCLKLPSSEVFKTEKELIESLKT